VFSKINFSKKKTFIIQYQDKMNFYQDFCFYPGIGDVEYDYKKGTN
jgi:hypothetical protein